MSDQKSAVAKCVLCNRTTALKTNADVLQRLIANSLPSSARASSEARPTPVEHAAAAWSADIGACLKREMAPHPKCAGCGILMGPGHIEMGTDQQCRSCLERCTIGQKTGYANTGGQKHGRRGWHSDYAIKK